jgi:hypothetical protein
MIVEACGPQLRSEELEALRTESSDGFLKALRALIAKITAACDRAIEEGNDRVASSYANNIINAMRLLSEVVKLIGDASTMNINNAIILTPAVWEIRSAILRALVPFPEARHAVLAALRG